MALLIYEHLGTVHLALSAQGQCDVPLFPVRVHGDLLVADLLMWVLGSFSTPRRASARSGPTEGTRGSGYGALLYEGALIGSLHALGLADYMFGVFGMSSAGMAIWLVTGRTVGLPVQLVEQGHALLLGTSAEVCSSL